MFVLGVNFSTKTAHAQTPGIEYTVVLNGSNYEVYMRPNFTPTGNPSTTSIQVTLKVPTGFVMTGVTSAIPATSWDATVLRIAPPEAPGFDYITINAGLSPRGKNLWRGAR